MPDSGGGGGGLLSPRALSIPSGLPSAFLVSPSSSPFLSIHGSPAPRSSSPRDVVPASPSVSFASPVAHLRYIQRERGQRRRRGRGEGREEEEEEEEEEEKEELTLSSSLPLHAPSTTPPSRRATWQAEGASSALLNDRWKGQQREREREKAIPQQPQPQRRFDPSDSSTPPLPSRRSSGRGAREEAAAAVADRATVDVDSSASSAVLPLSASPFVATFPSSASSQSTITVALSPLSQSTASSAPFPFPLGSPSPASPWRAQSTASPPLPFAAAEAEAAQPLPPSSPSFPSTHSMTDSRGTAASPRAPLPLPRSAEVEASMAAGGRRSSLPLRLPSSLSSSPSSSAASSTSSLLHRLRGMGSSAWSRSTVDRFGRSTTAKPGHNPDTHDPNAWGLDEHTLHTIRTHSAHSHTLTATASAGGEQLSATAGDASTASTGEASSASPASSPLSPSASPSVLPWNFGYLPAQHRGLRRSSLPPRSPAGSTYADRVRKAAMQRPDTAQDIEKRERRESRRKGRKGRDSGEADVDARPWGHWSQRGIRDGEEPRHPFPHTAQLFRVCTASKRSCTDRLCAKHGEGEGESEEEEEAAASAAARGRRVSEEEKEGGWGASVHDNMSVVRLRGAGDAALLAAFSRATPAYAALTKLQTPSALDGQLAGQVSVDDELE